MALPEGAQTREIGVRRIILDGAPADLAQATAAIIGPLEGRRVTVAQIFVAARALEQAYVRAGHILARVVVPAQSIDDGADVRLLVVEGRIGRLDLAALPARARARVGALLQPLVGRQPLMLADLERQLLLADDMPGLTLRSSLAPGEQAGETILVLQGEQQSASAFMAFDNSLASELGTSTLAVGLELNNLAGRGDQLYLRLSGFPGADIGTAAARNRQVAGGLAVALGPDGTSLNLEAVLARTTPLVQAEAPGFQSDFRRWSARLRHPMLRSRARSLSVETALDLQSERLDLISPLPAPLSFDRLRVLRLALDGNLAVGTAGSLSGRAVMSQGIGLFGARDGTADLPLSRLGVVPWFRRIEAQFQYSQTLSGDVAVQFAGRGQWAFGSALPRTEQFGMAGPGMVSGLDAGSIIGDSGYALRSELHWSRRTRLGTVPLLLAPYGFGAGGVVGLELPSAVERSRVRAASYGLGLRLAANPSTSVSAGFSVGLEYARAHRSDAGDENRFTLSANFRS